MKCSTRSPRGESGTIERGRRGYARSRRARRVRPLLEPRRKQPRRSSPVARARSRRDQLSPRVAARSLTRAEDGRPAHATRRAARSGPARPLALVPRASRDAANRSPRPRPRYARIGPAERARGTQTRAAECARFCRAIGSSRKPEECSVRRCSSPCWQKYLRFLCSARSLEKLRERNVASFPSRRETGSVSSTLFIMRTTRRGESVAFFPEQRERTNARRGETEPKRSSGSHTSYSR